jgi:hypothetical protein
MLPSRNYQVLLTVTLLLTSRAAILAERVMVFSTQTACWPYCLDVGSSCMAIKVRAMKKKSLHNFSFND